MSLRQFDTGAGIGIDTGAGAPLSGILNLEERMVGSGLQRTAHSVRRASVVGATLIALFLAEYFSPIPAVLRLRLAVVVFVLPMIAVCLSALRARSRSHALERIMWTLIAASGAAFSAGWIFSAAWVFLHNAYPPAGAFEDVGILTGFLLLLGAVLLLGATARLSAMQWLRNGLDMAAVLLIAAAFWYWAIAVPLHAMLPARGSFANLALAAYPILALALAGFVLGFSRWRKTAWARLLVAGFIAGAIAAVFVALLLTTPWEFNTNPVSTGIIDAIIMTAFTLISLAAIARVDPEFVSGVVPAPLGEPSPFSGVAVSILGLAAVPFLVWLSVSRTEADYSVFFGAMAALLAALLIGRNLTVIVENARLSDASLAAQRYQAVIESSPVAIVVMDTDGTILFANDAAVRTSEAESALDLIGLDRTALIDTEFDNAEHDAAWHRFAEAIEAGTEIDGPPQPWYTFSLITFTGRRVWVERTLRPISYEGRRAILSQFIDITARVEAERESEEYRARLGALASELLTTEEAEQRRLAEALHDEVSQPLAVSRMHMAAGMADLSIQGMHADESMRLLDMAIARASNLTARISPPFLGDLGLRKALEWLADDFRDHYSLAVGVMGEIDEHALGDEARSALYRTCRELLHNVVKHACVDRAEVTLAQADGFVSVTVEDRGAGFAENVRASDHAGGFGLLSIRERLPRLGGDFEVGSGAEGGVRATARLPVRPLASRRAASASARRQVAPPRS